MDSLKRLGQQLSGQSVDTPTGVSNLALILASARALEEQALAARRRLLGDEHPDTLMTMNGLAWMLKAKGDFAGARGLEEELLATRRRLLGDKHLDTLRTVLDLATTLSAQGDPAGARVLYEQVLAIRGQDSFWSTKDDLSPGEMLSLSIAAHRALPKIRA